MDSKQDNVFYVGVRDPLESRRGLLECSKEIIGSLQRYEKFKNIRTEKIERIIELKSIMLELNKLNLELNGRLPKTGLRAVHKEKEKTGKRKERVRVVHKKRSSELDKLENELTAIEEKLTSLVK